VLDHLDGIHLSPDAQALLASIEEPILRESTRDYFVNMQFRRDYFMRGARRMAQAVQQHELRGLRFVLARPAALVELKVKGALGMAKLHDNVYQPIVDALGADGSKVKSLAEIEELVASSNIAFPQLVQATVLLVGKGDVYVAQSEAAAKEVRPRTRALNQFLVRRSETNGDAVHLASPLTGGGVTATRIEQLFMLSMSEGAATAEDWGKRAWAALSSQNQRVLKDGKPVESPEDNLAELTRQANEWQESKLPVLRWLDVLE
jgi:hypothetical protein